MQLYRKDVRLFDPMKNKFITPEDIMNKFGVEPKKVIDVQSLAGDSSDNIPGVPGIGVKTAAELINQYGTLEKLLDNAHEIKQNEDISLVLICETGNQSANAGEKLQNLGHKGTLILSGGINNWRMDNLPLI